MPRCRLFAIDDALKEVVPNALYSKHLFGTSVSVSVVKFVLPGGPGLEAKSHAHGEEATLQVKGGCSVFVEKEHHGAPVEIPMGAGTAMVIPAQAMHFGTNIFDASGMSL